MGFEIETWNMAEQTLQRLSKLLDLCVDCSLKEEYGYWFKCLIELKKNLSAFLNDKELEELENLFDQLPQGWWHTHERRINQDNKIQVTKLFDDIYIFCVRKMKKKGLLMPESKDPGRAVSRMS